MSASPVVTIEPGGVSDIEMAHELAQITGWRLHEEVIMIEHQDKAVENDIIRSKRIRQNSKKLLSVAVAFEDSLSLIATAGNMIDSTGILDSKRSCHGLAINKSGSNVKSKDLTPPTPPTRSRIARF